MNPFRYQLRIALSDGRKHVTEVQTAANRYGAEEAARKAILNKHGVTEVINEAGNLVVMRTREVVSVTLLGLP